MSRTIDERIVEMRFDNRQFEENVQTSLTTLDKLKRGLNLDGAAKGLENLGTAAKNCSLSALSSSVETVRAKFSALEVMAMTALANITNSVVNTGKRMISAFTVEPVVTGFREYELKMDSVQTIMAGTGESLDRVNQKLDELNTYSDRTIYSFSDMTTSIGKFTNAGVKLDDAVAAIQGISNEAAVSGANAQQASHAMYNFAQALSSGAVKLIDWKSIETANMATVEFKNELIKTAVELGTLVEIDGQYKTTTTDLNGKVSDLFDSTKNFNDSLAHQWMTTDVLVKTLGRYADETTEIGKKAFAAAQDVKTFSQLLDTLKEAAQSGWAETWQLFVGDFDEAKVTLTEFSELFGAMIDRSSDARNALLGGTLMSSWGQLKQQVSEAGFSVDAFTDALQTTAKESVNGFDKMVEKAGSFDKTLSQGWLTTDILAKALDRMASEAAGTSGGIAVLTDEQLRNIGCTQDQIESLRSLSKQANSSTGDIAELVKNMTRKSGRELLFDSLLNSAKAVQKVFGTLHDAWNEVFPPATSERLYGIIDALHSFSEKLVISDETSEKLRRTFKGVFAMLDLGKYALTSLLEAISPLTGGLGALGDGLLDMTAAFGDWLIGINEAAKKGSVLGGAFQRISESAEIVSSGIRNCVDAIKSGFKMPGFEGFQALLGRTQERIGQVTDAMGGMGSVVGKAAKSMGTALLNCDFLQTLRTFYDGAKTIGDAIVKVIGGFASGIVEKLGNTDFRGALDLLNSISFGAVAVGITKFLNGVQEPFEGAGKFLEGVTKTLDEVRGCFEAYQTQLKAGVLLKIAAAIGILAAAIVAISMIDSEKLSDSLGAVTVLFADLMGSMAIFSKIGDLKKVAKACAVMLSISTSIFILASALRKISDLNLEQLAVGLAGIGGLMAEIALFLNTAKFSGKSIATATGIVILAGAVKLLVTACKDFGQMKGGELAKGLAAVGALLLELAAFTNLAGNAKHVVSTGLAMIEIAAAMKIFASAMSDFGSMDWEQIGKGLTGMGGALAEVAIAVNLMPKNMVGIGLGLIGVGTALATISDSLGNLGGMSWEEIAKGLVAMGGALAELTIGLNLMNGTLAGSAAMLVAAGALAALTPVLVVLGSMSWESIAKGLIALAGAFTVLGVAGAVLTPLVPSILGLAGAFALIGVGALGIGAGLLAIGAGLSAIAIGITALATSMGAGVAIIVAGLASIITGIASLIPAIAVKLGEAVIAFAGVIAAGAPVIGEAVKALILTVVDVLAECTPAIANGMLQMITEVLSSLAAYTPQMVDSLMQFLIGLLDGIAQNMPELVQTAVNLLMSFFAGITDALSGMDTDTLLKGIVGIGLLSGIMAALGVIAGLIPGAMAGILGIGAVVAEIALVLAAVGALAQIPGLSWLIGEGGKLLEGIGAAIGSFVGGIVGGFMSGVSSQFPQIGADLSAFMTNVQPFIDGASSISPDMLSGVKALTEALLLLTAADILNGLTSWITGGSSMTKFAEQLVPFGKAMSSFSKSIAGVNASAVSNSATAGKALAKLADTVPKCGGLIGFFTGNRSMEAFGDSLVLFGSDLAAYANAIRGINPDMVTASASAASALSNLADGLPDSSVFDRWFGGDQTLASFGNDLAEFGEAMERFYSHISDTDPARLSGVVAQVRSLADLAQNVKGVGKNAFSGFSSALEDLAKVSLTEFTGTFSGSGAQINRAVLAMLNEVNAAISKNRTIANPSMEKIMLSLASVIRTKSSAVNAAAVQMMSGLSATIRNSGSSVGSAMNSVLTTALSRTQSSFAEVGRNAAQGLVNGVDSNMYAVSAAGRNLGGTVLNSAKKALDSHSPSEEFISLGEDVGEGMAIGVENGTAPAAAAASQMAAEVIKASEKGLEAFKNWVSDKKYYGELSVKDELAGWEHLQSKYKSGSKERKEIDKEVFRTRNELASESYQASMDWIEEEKYYNRLSLEQELAAYERVQARYLAGTEERKKADREVYRLRNELASASYQYSMDWIEEEKYYGRMSLADELAAYKRVQSRYAKGTDEWKKMDREVYRLEKEISDAQKQYTEEVQRVQSEASQRRLELEEEYADKVRSVNERLAQDIQSLNDQYQNAVESRTDSLYRSYNLFDAVKKREAVSSETLMKNLEGQVQEFGEWQDILGKLSARGLDSELIAELQEMGPDAISEIQALNSMSDSELEKYTALWAIKHAQAREQAVSELEGLRIETQDNIAQLRAEADEELEEYCDIWQQKMRQVTEDADAELEQLQKDFAEKVGIIKTDTTRELQEMAEISRQILREAGWDETGQQIVTGLIGGVQSQQSGFLSVLTNMALAGVAAVKSTLGIHSPSRVFRELGSYTGLGFINGLNSFAEKSHSAGSELAESAKLGLSNVLHTISDIVSNGIDAEPTIRPVLDLSNVARGADEIGSLFGSQRTLGLVGRASAAFGAADTGRMEIAIDNNDVVRELRELRGDMAAMSDTIGKLKIVLDTGTLVGEMAGPMNAALGQRLVYEGRGI